MIIHNLRYLWYVSVAWTWFVRSLGIVLILPKNNKVQDLVDTSCDPQ